MEKIVTDTLLAKDQFKITKYDSNGNEIETYDETFTEILPKQIKLVSINEINTNN